MTSKRDLKNRVRDRQARTGESYTAARSRVLAARPAPTPAAIPVDEMIDVSDTATSLGLRCKVLIANRLAAQIEPLRVVTAVRDALTAIAGDPGTEILRAIAFRGEPAPAFERTRESFDAHRRFLAGVRAGVGGTSAGGRMLALHLAGTDGVVAVLCAAWRREATLVLSLADAGLATLSRLGPPPRIAVR